MSNFKVTYLNLVSNSVAMLLLLHSHTHTHAHPPENAASGGRDTVHRHKETRVFIKCDEHKGSE